MIGPAIGLDDLHELTCEQFGALFSLRVRGKNHGVAGLEGKHRIAHRRHDRIGDGCDCTDDAHRLGHELQIGLGIFANDSARLLPFQAVPDDAGLPLVLENLVFVDADAGLVHGHSRQQVGIVVHVLADALDDGIDLLLREGLKRGLGDRGSGHKLLNLRIGNVVGSGMQ